MLSHMNKSCYLKTIRIWIDPTIFVLTQLLQLCVELVSWDKQIIVLRFQMLQVKNPFVLTTCQINKTNQSVVGYGKILGWDSPMNALSLFDCNFSNEKLCFNWDSRARWISAQVSFIIIIKLSHLLHSAVTKNYWLCPINGNRER